MDEIDEQAEREAQALDRQGRRHADERVRQASDYNQTVFDRLFAE